MTYHGSWGTGREMLILECLRDSGGNTLPINVVSLQKIQEECYVRSIERGNVSSCDNRRKYIW